MGENPPIEFLDVLDVDGNPLGVSKPRSQVHTEGLWRRCTHVWIINSKGELVLQKRADRKESHPSLWDISSAGHVSAGDSSLITALREAEEELGINLVEEELEPLFTRKVQHVRHEGKYSDNE